MKKVLVLALLAPVVIGVAAAYVLVATTIEDDGYFYE